SGGASKGSRQFVGSATYVSSHKEVHLMQRLRVLRACFSLLLPLFPGAMKRAERGRLIACVVVSAILIAGWAFAASGSNLRKIVVFVDGTRWQGQQQVIGRSGSLVLNILSLIKGVGIQLPEHGTAH